MLLQQWFPIKQLRNRCLLTGGLVPGVANGSHRDLATMYAHRIDSPVLAFGPHWELVTVGAHRTESPALASGTRQEIAMAEAHWTDSLPFAM